MVLFNSLRVIPPEDPLGKDAITQLVLEVIEVFVDVFTMEPSEVFIDASLVHRGMLIEAIKTMVPNWDLNCRLEDMQLAVLAHCLDTWRIYLLDRKFVVRTCVLHSHMYCTGIKKNPEAKEELMGEVEPWVEFMAGIIVISSDDEEELTEEPEIKVILVESSDDESMEEINGEVVQADLSDV
ncbi:hypothetical protein Pyn_34014 [Prunus yedoensis var. nudiflora]|uniref:Uncharacterized protein n=1 Tax=Prunus yedoensis var. nudiflora TaxID=2094558 RepID=A0A314UDV9_PRUYE|nr:hypothetical protein Pyn_34014 [Prunus yedoensis var. nudiflora]